MSIIQDELEEIELHVGDIIIQHSSGFMGILIEKFRNFPLGGELIEGIWSDIWFWRVQWLKNIDRRIDMSQAPFLNETLEEEGLKMSIFIGNIYHYSHGKFTEIDHE
tara:strand:+ start:800 stop:1120 length:321 start_codon:yes stop_codon:yes gene_type:complete